MHSSPLRSRLLAVMLLLLAMPAAIVGATLPGSPDKAPLFGYEKGAPMVSGVAPARRVGMFLSDSGLLPDLVTPQTVQVFDASVSWALGRT